MAGLVPAVHVSGAKDQLFCFIVPFFADLVVIARSLYPIPSRTRPSNSSAPMVLSLKAWKSRSLPGLPRTERFILFNDLSAVRPRGFFVFMVIVVFRSVMRALVA